MIRMENRVERKESLGVVRWGECDERDVLKERREESSLVKRKECSRREGA